MITLKNFKSFYIILVLASMNINMVESQLKGPKYDERLLFKNVRGINLSFVSQEWNLADSASTKITVAQTSTPFSTSIPITTRMLLTITGSVASSSNDVPQVVTDTSGNITTLENDKYEMKGLSDTKLAMSYVVPGDKLWINGGLSFPTGQKKLTSDQFKVSRMISQAGLNFRVPIAGQGFNANLGLAYAYSYSRRIVLGFGMSGTYKGIFEPIAIENIEGSNTTFPNVEYNPGEDFSMNSGIDYTSANKEQRFSSDLTFSYYLPDQINNQKTFQVGPRFNALILLSQKFGPTTNVALLRGRYRLKNTIFSSDSLSTPNKYPSAKQFEFQYVLTVPVLNWFTLNGNFEYKYHTADQFPLGDKIMETGNVDMASFGVDVNAPITDWLVLMLATKKGSGKLVIEGKEYDADGFEFGLGVKISL